MGWDRVAYDVYESVASPMEYFGCFEELDAGYIPRVLQSRVHSDDMLQNTYSVHASRLVNWVLFPRLHWIA